MTVTFGAYELDYGQRRLFRAGVDVHLSPKALDLLNVLVMHAPNAVSKQALYDAIWPSTFVSETNLPGLVAELRAVLRDDAHRPKFIRTVHGFGYSFDAPLRQAEGPQGRALRAEWPRFRLWFGGREISLPNGQHIVGRSVNANVFVDDASVSREHAKLVADEDSVVLTDLGSKNGTFVNGVPVSGGAVLRDRDVVTVGIVAVEFRDGHAAETTITIRRNE